MGHDAKYSFLTHPHLTGDPTVLTQKYISGCVVRPPTRVFSGVRSVEDTSRDVVFAAGYPLHRANGPILLARQQPPPAMSGPQLVHLEMDEKDKESLHELQQGMAQAQQEAQMLQAKLQMRESERRRSDLTLHELADLPDTARAYKQVGKMFLMHSLPDLM